MKITGKIIAEMARYLKGLSPEPCQNNTFHFYLEDAHTLNVYEDVSGQESYPGETGTPLISTNLPYTRKEIAYLLDRYGFTVPAHLLRDYWG